MSQDELPDDILHWPQDPFELLGVRPDDEFIVVKRAYTRLIRRFKPEHFPAQFIRLREAYEQIRDRDPNDLVARNDVSVSDHNDQHTAAQVAEGESSNTQSVEHTQNLARHEQVWQLASTGSFDQALDLLHSHTCTPSETASMLLTEYWVTKLKWPEPGNSEAAQILMKNLHRYRRLPNVLALARRELQWHPSLLIAIDLAQCAEGLLDFEDLSELIKLRWDIALCERQYDVIANDWSLLAKKYFDYPKLHAHIALLAVDYLSWSPSKEHRSLVEKIVEEVELAVGLGNQYIVELSRIERLFALRAELCRFQECHPQWQELAGWAPAIWNRVALGYHAAAAEWLVKAIQDSTMAILFFDQVCDYAEVLQFYVKCFDAVICACNEYAEPSRMPIPMSATLRRNSVQPTPFESEQIEYFLASYDAQPYERFRIEIARFSIEQNIAPQKIAGYIESNPSIIAEYMRVNLLEKLQADVSLLRVTQLLQQCSF